MFYVVQAHTNDFSLYKNSFVLIKDRWDDWFKYETQHYLHYVDENSVPYEIGYLKIGQRAMTNGQRSAVFPDAFDQLPDDCFSLGQSDRYYERINQLGDHQREYVLTSLRDISFDADLYAQVRRLDVTATSLMRDVSHFTLVNQYRRIAHGNARLTTYDIEYTYPGAAGEDEVKLTFHVEPDSNPPTNIHVVIGRNNVGKTYLIKNIISSIYSIEDGYDHGVLRSTNSKTGRLVNSKTQAFANVLCVSFSPFDDYSEMMEKLSKKNSNAIHIYWSHTK